MKMYEEYKDTGDIWLQSVPAHWKNKSIKSIMKLSDERCGNREYLELLSVYREYGVIKKSSRDDNYNKESEDTSKYKYVGKNYIVMNKMKMWQGSLGISKYEGIVSPAYIVCKPTHNFNNKFLNYLLRSNKLKHLYNIISYGVRVGQWDLRFDDIKNYNLYIPPPFEQDQIVRFLDNKLEKIDRLIAIKKRQIELLKERKTHLIDKSVTFGINSGIQVKDSGINWLGKINLNWKIVTLKDILSSGLKYGANESAQTHDKSSPRYIRITDIDNNGKLKDTFVSLPREIAGKYILKNGDILFARSGATVGKSFLYQESYGVCCYAGYLIKASINLNLINPKFLILYTQSSFYNAWVNMINIQSTIQNISAAKYLELAIPLPPINVQNNIVQYLDEKIAKIKYIEEKITSLIELLNEYRTRLISEAVTGAIDVSNWKSNVSS